MTRSTVLLLPIISILIVCQTTAPTRVAQAPEFFASTQQVPTGLPFSDAVRADDFLFLPGQIGNVLGKLELVPGGIGAEAAQALDNIKTILGRNGSSVDALVKCTVFLADIHEWPAFNKVYATSFPHHFAIELKNA
jgi:2-iminobutanoate/2-iminopropanoate deaminase